MAERLDHRTFRHFDAGTEYDVRLDRYVSREPCVVSEPHALRIDQRRALVEHLLAAAALPFELQMGELGAAVDPRRLVGVAFDDHCLAALGSGDIDHVRQIIFAGGVVVSNLAEPAEQVGGADRHHARIAQADRPLLLGRVLIFDHLRDPVAFAKDDAAIFEGIVGLRSEHDHAGPAVAIETVEHAAQRFGLDERRVAVEDQDRAVVAGERIRRLLNGMPGTLLLGLVRDRHIATANGDLDLVAALADDHDALFGAERVDPLEQVQQQRAAGDRVKHLVGVRAHAGALPCGEDDYGETALVAHRARAMAWRRSERQTQRIA